MPRPSGRRWRELCLPGLPIPPPSPWPRSGRRSCTCLAHQARLLNEALCAAYELLAEGMAAMQHGITVTALANLV